MLQIFMYGTLWFWMLCVASAVLIIYSTETSDISATLWFIISLALIGFLGNQDFFINIGHWIIYSPGKTLLVCLGYFLLGTVWSFIKWGFFLHKKRRHYIDSNTKITEFDFKYLKAIKNKGKIINWMIYWPLSLLWTLINDPVKRIFEKIFYKVSSIYDKMSFDILKDVVDNKMKNEK